MNSRETSSLGARARLVVRALQEAFDRRQGVFSDTTDLLEHQIPDGVPPASREHANFLFFLISQDHGTKSSRLYAKAKSLYQESPEHFDPLFVSANYHERDAGLLEFISSLGVRYPRAACKGWRMNATRLTSEFEGDARLVFKSQASASDTMHLIRSFYGFGPKIGGLLFRVFVGTGMADLAGIEDVEFPTDIHDTRIAALTGIATIPVDINESNYSPYVRDAQRAWKRACTEEGVDWLQVDRALWILGSRGCVSERHSDCPIRASCLKGHAMLW